MTIKWIIAHTKQRLQTLKRYETLNHHLPRQLSTELLFPSKQSVLLTKTEYPPHPLYNLFCNCLSASPFTIELQYKYSSAPRWGFQSTHSLIASHQAGKWVSGRLIKTASHPNHQTTTCCGCRQHGWMKVLFSVPLNHQHPGPWHNPSRPPPSAHHIDWLVGQVQSNRHLLPHTQWASHPTNHRRRAAAIEWEYNSKEANRRPLSTTRRSFVHCHLLEPPHSQTDRLLWGPSSSSYASSYYTQRHLRRFLLGYRLKIRATDPLRDRL